MKAKDDTSTYEISNWIDATTEITFMMIIMKALATMYSVDTHNVHRINVLNTIPLTTYMHEHLVISTLLDSHEFYDVDGIVNACDGFKNILDIKYLLAELVKYEEIVDKSDILREIQDVILENTSIDEITKIYKYVTDTSDSVEKPLGEKSMILCIMLAISNIMEIMKRRPLNGKYEEMTSSINEFFEKKRR